MWHLRVAVPGSAPLVDCSAINCRALDATYYNWPKRFGGMGRSQLSEMKSLETENVRLKKIVAELELDKLILKESLNHLKPRVPLTGR